MNVLLINPPIRLTDNPYVFPIGLGYIASSLIQAGHKVEALDINGQRWPEEEVRQKINARIKEFDAVGVGGLITTYKYVKWLISVIKEARPNIPVIVGDNGATFSYHLYLEKAKADIAVIGEGDMTIKEVIKAIEKKSDLTSVKGVVFKSDGKIFKTPPRERIEHLDELPYPQRDIFPIEKYITSPLSRMGGMRFLVLSATRGCPYRCKFCYPAFGRVVKLRSARSIVDEIKFIKERYNLDCVGFTDDLFIINRKRVLEFCQLLIEEEVDIKWCSTARADLVDSDILKKMKESGCFWLGYGIESANPHVLFDMKKGFTVEQASNGVRLTKMAGIFCATTWIIGWPNETPKSVRDTMKFIIREELPFLGLNYATPYPGSELYDDFVRSGRIEDEESFIMKLGDARDFVVNLTCMPDEQLIRLKDKLFNILGERFGPFTVRLLKISPKAFQYVIKFFWFLRFWGFVPTMKRVIKYYQKYKS